LYVLMIGKTAENGRGAGRMMRQNPGRARARSQFVFGWSGVVSPPGQRSVTELLQKGIFVTATNRNGNRT